MADTPLDHTPRGVDLNGPDAVVVYVSQGPLAAEVALSKLRATDVPCALRYPSAGRIWGLTLDGLGRVEVVVPAAWADQARDILVEEEPPSEEETSDGEQA